MPAPEIPSKVTVIDHPLARVKLTTLRDRRTGAGEFRARAAELGALLVFEATRDLGTLPDPVQTPLATHRGAKLARPVVIVPILRAGLGMLQGMLPLIPEASVGHIGMRRDEKTHLADCYYFNMPPDLSGADVIVVDPMLATGGSAIGAIAKLKAAGAGRIRFVCFVSCPEGLARMEEAHPDVRVFTVEVDAALDERAYIVPGLGDAGDRYFGTVPPVRSDAE
jgi:uracil phosphoribosyltransferase